MITLAQFKKTQTDNGAVVSCTVEIDGETRNVSFEIDCEANLAQSISVKPVAFVIAFLIPAMERGENIYVDGILDAAQLHKINTYVISILAEKNRDLTVIDVKCKTQQAFPDAISGPRGALTGMSCGVDSLRTLMVYGNEGNDIPDRYRLKYFGVYDVGAFYDPAQQYPHALEKARVIAAENNYAAFGVSSDFGKYYKTNFALSCTMRHVACTTCLSDFVDVYLVSSAYPWQVIGIVHDAPTAMEALDPILLPMLSSSQLEMFSACANEKRDNKSRSLIVESPYLDQIDVCTRPTDKRDFRINCATCQKCADFVLLAQNMGHLDKVAPSFDLASFERRKFRVFQRIFTAQTIFRRDFPGFVRNEVVERSVPSPFGAIFVGILFGKIILFTRMFRIKKRR